MADATPEQLELAEKIANEIGQMYSMAGPTWEQSRKAALAAIIETTERAAKLADEQEESFLSPEYAVGQPLSSFSERFACGQIATALRNQEHLKND